MKTQQARAIRKIVPVATLLVAVASAGCDWALLDPDRRYYSDRYDRDIEGRYDGTFVLEWDGFRRGGRRGYDEGRGSIRIDRAYRSGFDGEWRWRLDGRWLQGRLERGRRDFRGEISFSLDARYRADLLEELTGCLFTSGDRRFRGYVDRTLLRAERSARLRCRDPFSGRWEDLRVRVSFSGRRGYRY